MANGYATHIMRMVAIATIITLSGQIYASDHGMMVSSKRNKLGCGQLLKAGFMALLFTSTGGQAMECAKIEGDNPNIGAFIIKDPVCADSLGYHLATRNNIQTKQYVAGRVDAAGSHSTPSTISIEPIPCTTIKSSEYVKTRTETSSCLNFNRLERSDISYLGPRLQLPAPEQQ